MPRAILGKMMRGANQAAQPFLLSKYRANLDTMKQEKLQQYEDTRLTTKREHQVEDREDMQAHQKELVEMRGNKGGRDSTPSEIKIVEYLVNNKIAKDKKDAYRMVRLSKTDPNKAVMQLAEMLQKADEWNNEKKTTEEYLMRAKELSQKFLSTDSQDENTDNIDNDPLGIR